MKWARMGLAALMVVALLSASTWAKGKPPKDPSPKPDPPPRRYTITWLDTFPYSEVEGLNSNGDVVGYAKSPDRYGGEPFAFVKYASDNEMVDLNTLLPEGSDWFLTTTGDINNLGQIVGYGYFGADDRPQAFRYTPAVGDGDPVIEKLVLLQTDDQLSSAGSINESGEVCGYTRDSSGIDHVWFYSDDFPSTVPVLSGTADNPLLRPRRINESRQILVARPNWAVDWNAARVTPFGASDYFIASGQDMNDNGWFVGLAPFEVPINKKKVTIEYRAFRYDETGFFDLGAGKNSEVFGINNNGDVVGHLAAQYDVSTGELTPSRAFVYLDNLQELVNLNDAVVGDEADVTFWTSPDTWQYALYINDAGVITGDLDYLGDTVIEIGFVLTPDP